MYTYDCVRRSIALVSIFCGLVGNTAAWLPAQETTPPSEASLLAMLRSSAPAADKALACKHLAVFGSAAAVPELAPLLHDEQLASWARIALEAIPGSEADAALRNACGTLEGRLLMGAIHSLGVRRDPMAVELLAQQLEKGDIEVAVAAAYALGQVGSEAAATALRTALQNPDPTLRSAAAEGCVVCAEQRLGQNELAAAAALYDAVRGADVPLQRKLEATRGSILTRGDEGLHLVRELLNSEEPEYFALALTVIREVPGDALDRQLSLDISTLPPERAVWLIHALADRAATVDLPTLLTTARQGPLAVRLAAIAAVGRVGSARCVAPLLDLTADTDQAIALTARRALAEVPDPTADREILDALGQAEGPRFIALLTLIGERRLQALEALEAALEHSDSAVRHAALVSLGQTVTAERFSTLLAQVLMPQHADDLQPASAALKTAAVRMADREACAAQLAGGLSRAAPATKITLLEILGAVGGRKALDALHAAAQAEDPQLQDASTRLLGEWMTLDAAPVLLDLANTAAGAKYKTRALRGYIRLVRQFNMSEAQRVEMCRNAWNAAEQLAEQRLVLQVLERYPLPGTLDLARQAAQIEELKQDASQAAVRIAQQLGTEPEQLMALMSELGLPKVSVEIVRAEYGAGAQRQDVTTIVRARTRDSQMIVLASPNFNEAFGGDPMPGTPKQLTIKFRLDGKEGEAAFAENALILLPLPK